MTFNTINPANGDILAEYELMTTEEVLTIAEQAHASQKQWAKLSLEERSPYFTKLAQVLRENLEEYATLMSKEMGKPLRESRGEVEKCAFLAEQLIEKAPIWLKEEEIEADGLKHRIVFDPLGVVFLIMPWNYPFWQPLKVGLSPLIAGNGIILKHARNVTGSALAIQDAFKKAGFPEHLFRTVIVDHHTSNDLVASEHVHACSLTGSEYAGSKIAEQAGKHLKKTVLELGGSDPFIVLDDADVDVTAKGAVKGRFSNAGQVCISSKRIIVMRGIADAFTKRFVELVNELSIGDPLDETTNIGPLVNAKAVDEMKTFVDDAVSKGAKILTGGRKGDMVGNFYLPTVLDNTHKEMNAVCHEVFGPVAPIIIVDTEEEAIHIANDNDYGLGGSVWSTNLDRAEKVGRKLETGSVFINSITKTHPMVPVGGIKRSGYGRELSHYGIKEFCNIKTINVYEHK